MSLLDRFLRITSQNHPALGDVMKSIASGLHIYMPIQISQIDDKKKLGINLQSNISRNETIFMVSAQKSFTSLGYDGVDRAKSRKYDEFIRELITQVYSRQMIPQLFGFYKILIQVAVNILDPNQRLHKYARYLKTVDLKNSPYYLPVETIEKIESKTLKSAIIGNLRTFEQAQHILASSYPGLAAVNLAQLLLIVYSRCITLNQTILCPLIDMLNHSSKPNCQIEGIYNPHVQSSYLVVKSLRPIKPDEQLTISYGNLSNMQMYLRYGFTEPNNPHSVYIMKANFDECLESLEQLYELKEDLFKRCGGLKDTLKVTQNGLLAESARLLRIFFLTQRDVAKNKNILDYTPMDFDKEVSRENEKRVSEYLYDLLDKSGGDVCDISDVDIANEIEKDERRIRSNLMMKLRKQVQMM